MTSDGSDPPLQNNGFVSNSLAILALRTNVCFPRPTEQSHETLLNSGGGGGGVQGSYLCVGRESLRIRGTAHMQQRGCISHGTAHGG